MNIYAIFPIIATLAYIPLIITTISNRPWQQKHRLFIAFLVVAMMWSLADYVFRANLLPQHNLLMLKIIVVLFTAMAVQYHCFISSFYGPGQSRWLLLAYFSLALVISLVILGEMPDKVVVDGDKLYPYYGRGIFLLAIPLLILLARSSVILWRRLIILENPALRNQILSLLLGLLVLTVFTLVSVFPPAREFPICHFGNLINAILLSYATIRHQLLDVRLVLRNGLVWMVLGIIGVLSYWILLLGFEKAFHFQVNIPMMFSVIVTSAVVSVFVYKLRGFIFAGLGRAFGGQSYDFRNRLFGFTREIHTVFSLKEQGGELLELVTKAIGCQKACLLFADESGGDFRVQLSEPRTEQEVMASLVLRDNNPVVEYLRKEGKPLTRDDVAILPEFRSLWQQEKDEIQASDIELFMPLISRGRLIGILGLDKKRYGRYTLEDFTLLEEVTGRVAVSMEKEYLRELLRVREEELSIINRSSAIITSSLDIQRTYGNFIKELKRAVNVNWAAIVLLDEAELYFLALSSEIGSAWQVGERIPVKDTAVESVVATKAAVIESDLLQEGKGSMKRYLKEHGIRSVVFIPLIVNNEVIGSLVVASRRPNAYSSKDVKLLGELASLIAMPIENSRLYARAEQMARNDGLTGLLNRRAMDELVASEVKRHSRYGGVFSLIILDLDSFKAYNDNFGHPAGDEILKRVGNIIKFSIRNTDQAFRYGGDEFAILLPQTDSADAARAAERLRNNIATVSDPGFIPITASMGIASWPTDGIGTAEVITAADTALLQAKRDGGNHSYLYARNKATPDAGTGRRESHEDSRVLSTIYNLAATVDARDHYTHGHSKKVNQYAVALAEALHLEPLEISRLSTCAFLHDIGKIGISDEILNKPGKLTSEEWRVVKEHTYMGAAIASHAGQLAPCIKGILHHHERYDGSGYPKGLKGEDIPLEARILAIADAYAAMITKRSYTSILTREEALEELKRCAGKQFDPGLVEAFQGIIEKEMVPLVNENRGR